MREKTRFYSYRFKKWITVEYTPTLDGKAMSLMSPIYIESNKEKSPPPLDGERDIN